MNDATNMSTLLTWLEHPYNNNWEVAYDDGILIGHYCFNSLNRTWQIEIVFKDGSRIFINPSEMLITPELQLIARRIFHTYYMSLKDDSLAS